VNQFSFLEKLRSRYLSTESEELLFNDKECTIEGTVYRLNSWKDFHGKDAIVVFELKKKGVLITNSYCIGIRFSANQETLLLSQEQLWEIGIP
jgi:hypothetical protein